jgi:hypothetical protein
VVTQDLKYSSSQRSARACWFSHLKVSCGAWGVCVKCAGISLMLTLCQEAPNAECSGLRAGSLVRAIWGCLDCILLLAASLFASFDILGLRVFELFWGISSEPTNNF